MSTEIKVSVEEAAGLLHSINEELIARVEARDKQIAELTAEVVRAIHKRDELKGQIIELTAALEEIRQVATGEKQVGIDDTEGLDWIVKRIKLLGEKP